MGRLKGIRVKERNDAQRPNSYIVIDSGGREFEFTPEQIRQALNQPAGSLPPITEANRVLSGDFEAEVWADKVRIHGRGWGHGVGLCQYCAKAFAEQGMDWPTMVKTFYPGVEVGKMYP
jgi:SpoIID/LytB domain protein